MGLIQFISLLNQAITSAPVEPEEDEVQGVLWDNGDIMLWDDATPIDWDETAWILAAGVWNDDGSWDDSNIWIDSI